MSYDALDRVTSIADGGTLARYACLGPERVIERRYGNGTRLVVAYDGGRRPVRWEHRDPADRVLVGFEYAYDREDNRIAELRIHEGEGDTFAYDSLYRLTRVGYDQEDPATATSPSGPRRMGKVRSRRFVTTAGTL